MILKYPENKTNTGAKTKLYFLITSLSQIKLFNIIACNIGIETVPIRLYTSKLDFQSEIEK